MLTTEELIEKCKDGDSSGYTGLYHLHSKLVYSSVYRLLNDTVESEDILQDTFITAFESLHQIKHAAAFGAWIKRIAINKAVNFLRKKKLKWVELPPDAEIIVDDEVIDEIAFNYTMGAIEQAIELLSDQHRTVFQLYAVENIAHVEIAQMLGISDSAVRTQYFRAKNKIINILKANQ